MPARKTPIRRLQGLRENRGSRTMRREVADPDHGKKVARRKLTALGEPVEGHLMNVAFQIEKGMLCIIDHKGDRIPIFEAERLDLSNPTRSLRSAIVTLMEDHEATGTKWELA